MFLGYKLKTEINGPLIVQELDYIVNDVREQVWRQIIDTSDQQVRLKLIEMGWTPPNEA